MWFMFFVAIAYIYVSGLFSGTDLSEVTGEWSPPVDLKSLKPGEMLEVRAGRGLYVVFRPTDEVAQDLVLLDNHVWQPKSGAWNKQHNFYIYSAISTWYSCKLQHRPKGRSATNGVWLGGYHDPCHNGSYDYAGRAIRSGQFAFHEAVHKTANLPVPEYRVDDDLNLYVLVN